MEGRYGADQLSRFLNFVAIALIVLSMIFGAFGLSVVYSVLWWLAVLIMLIALWRMFSKNISKRYQANVKYLTIKNNVVSFFRRKSSRIKQLKTLLFFKCPKCGQVVRTHKGKGSIRITCPKCREVFIRKS